MSVTAALTQLAIILADVDPDPQPAPLAVYAHPADFADVDLSSFPVIVVSRAVGEAETFGAAAAYRSDQHRWMAEILIFLGQAIVTPAQGAAMETAAQPWPAAVVSTLRASGDSLNSTVRSIGSMTGLFTAKQGHIHWNDNLYWGWRLLMPIIEEVAFD